MTLSPTCSAESEIEGWARGMQAGKNRRKEREGEMDDTERKLVLIVILTDSGCVDAALVHSAVSY